MKKSKASAHAVLERAGADAHVDDQGIEVALRDFSDGVITGNNCGYREAGIFQNPRDELADLIVRFEQQGSEIVHY